MLDILQKDELFYNERLTTSLTQKASMNVNTYRIKFARWLTAVVSNVLSTV